ncbi:MAG TPA: TetR/AcrR family transcriptional regulator [Longimicrobiales bacterium]
MPEERPAYDAKLDLIVRTAAAIIADKGFHRASIRDISRATGVSLSGLYYYFKSKDELLFLIQDHCFGRVLDNLERLLEGVTDPEERLRILIGNHLRFFSANMKEMKVLSHEAGSLTGEYRERVNAKKRRYAEVCADILRALRPAGSPVDLRAATFSLFGMLNWIYNWYHPDRDEPVEALAEDVGHLFLRGFLADPEADRKVFVAGGAPDDAGPSIWSR